MIVITLPEGTPIANGGDWGFETSDGQRLIARRFHGHYTIPEIESLLQDMRNAQQAIAACPVADLLGARP